MSVNLSDDQACEYLAKFISKAGNLRKLDVSFQSYHGDRQVAVEVKGSVEMGCRSVHVVKEESGKIIV